MSIKDYIKETKKKEIGFYINGEKSILNILLHKIKVLRNLNMAKRASRIVFKAFSYFKHIISLI